MKAFEHVVPVSTALFGRAELCGQTEIFGLHLHLPAEARSRQSGAKVVLPQQFPIKTSGTLFAACAGLRDSRAVAELGRCDRHARPKRKTSDGVSARWGGAPGPCPALPGQTPTSDGPFELRGIPTRDEHHHLHRQPDPEQQSHPDYRVSNQPDWIRPGHETVLCSASRIHPPGRPHRQFDR